MERSPFRNRTLIHQMKSKKSNYKPTLFHTTKLFLVTSEVKHPAPYSNLLEYDDDNHFHPKKLAPLGM